MRRWIAGFALVLAAFGLGTAPRDAGAGEGVSTVVEQALEDLRSPAERTRRAAVDRLVAELPAAREPVLQALEEADPTTRLLLVEVLAQDASPTAIRAVLLELKGSEGIRKAEIVSLLVRSRAASDQVLEVWRRRPALKRGARGGIAPEAAALEDLLRRAETERIFLGRKSKSGSTGSYRGQYDVLQAYREEALDLCRAIIMDRALPRPGLYASGVFEFIRPPDFHIDLDELRGMAAHAFSELARTTDAAHLEDLARFLDELEFRLHRYSAYDSRVEFYDVVSRYSDLLVALYLVQRSIYAERLDRFFRDLRTRRSWRNALPDSYRALVKLRVGRYAEAVSELEDLLYSLDVSKAGTHYNLACAYAQWGEEFEGREQEFRRQRALAHLSKAVEHQWSDIGWMEEDRDLDPIRDSDAYRMIARKVRDSLKPSGD